MLTDSLPLATLLPSALLSLVATVALVLCDYRDFRAGRYLFKPLAAIAFIWLALSLDATDTRYGQWLLAALALCLVGDVFLMWDNERSFLAGLAAFLCGHLLFAVAFFQLPVNLMGLAISALPVLVLLGTVWRWLMPHVNRDMKIPVTLYILVISAMLLCAGMTAGQRRAAFSAEAAIVARRQFILPASRLNGVWGTPLYFLSQMVLASSLALT